MNTVNKKSKLKTLWLILIAFLLISNIFNVNILIYNINPHLTNCIIYILIFILPILFFDYTELKYVKKIYIPFSILFSLLSIFTYNFLFAGETYYKFSSPNKNRTLVVSEGRKDSSVPISFYELKYKFIIKYYNTKSVTIADNYYQPFADSSYSVKWLDDNFVIVDYCINPVIDSWNTITIQF